MQDPPNGALECKVDGVATTTVVTITAPAVMTDESGVMTLTYDAELVSMTRGGPTLFNASAPVEDVMEEVVVCDEDSGASLYIDDVSSPTCPSPMLDVSQLPPELQYPQCYPSTSGSGCASGWTLEGSPEFRLSYCVESPYQP